MQQIKEAKEKAALQQQQDDISQGDGAGVATTNHHTPQFVDDQNNDPNLGTKAKAGSVVSPETFIASGGNNQKPSSSSGGSKSKQKLQSKETKKKNEELAEQVGAHLNQHGWAVCDNFLSLDLVRRIRIEAELFQEFYEQSEIWVSLYIYYYLYLFCFTYNLTCLDSLD